MQIKNLTVEKVFKLSKTNKSFTVLLTHMSFVSFGVVESNGNDRTAQENNKYNPLTIRQDIGGKDVSYHFSKLDVTLHYALTMKHPKDLLNLAHQIIYVPEEDIDEIKQFYNQNPKIYNEISNKAFAYYFYYITNGSPSLIQWANKNYIKGVSLIKLTHILKWCVKYNKLLNKLEKGTPTAYNTKESIDEMFKEMVVLRQNKRANNAIQSFNTKQKKMLKEKDLDKKQIQVLNRFTLLSNTKQRNFIRKMSTVEDLSVLFDQLSILTKSHYNWNKESLISYIQNNEDLSCEIIWENENKLLVKVLNYDTIKFLAKTTNWCISKNKTYWTQYISNHSQAEQYIIFNFNVKEDNSLSIIGVTLKYGNIIAAHNYVNDNILGEKVIMPNIKQYWVQKNNIYTILNDYGIPKALFRVNPELYCNWNRKSFHDYFEHNGVNVDIIFDAQNKLVFSGSGRDIAYLIKNNSHLATTLSYHKKIIVFCDFNLQLTETNALLFCLISLDENDLTESVIHLQNVFGEEETSQMITQLFDKYNISHEIICTPNLMISDVMRCLKFCDVKNLHKLIQNQSIRHALLSKEISKEAIFNSIFESLFVWCTNDLLATFYNNSIRLKQVLQHEQVVYILNNILRELTHHSNKSLEENIPDLTDETFDKLYNHEFNKKQQFILGSLHTFKLILTNEINANIISNAFINNLMRLHSSISNKLLPYVISLLQRDVNYLIKLMSSHDEFRTYVLNHVEGNFKDFLIGKLSVCHSN